MAARIGNNPLPPPTSTSTTAPTPTIPNGVPTDPRRDMLKELIASRLVTERADVEGTLREIVTRGEAVSTGKTTEAKQNTAKAIEQKPEKIAPAPSSSSTSPKDAVPAVTAKPVPTSEVVQRALQNVQREAGLPVTGRFDEATAALLKNLGVTTPSPANASKPAAPAPATVPVETTKKPIDPAQQQLARARSAGQESLLRARVDSAAARPTTTTTTTQQPALPQSSPLDRVLDPARLLASLFAAGFAGKSPDQALQSFQTAKGLPATGQLDPKTIEQLVSAGHLSSEAAEAHKDTKAPSANPSSATSTGASSDKAKADSSRQQQATTTATKAGDVSVRSPASSPAEAREMARLESLLAQANAVERGVQEGKGDPTATAGHGQNAGKATGLSGSGGSGGGSDGKGSEAAHESVGPKGDESSVGNSKAGDDNHDDERRGHASDAGNVDDHEPKPDDGTLPVGHYRVVKLSEQVVAALETIFRIDDNTLPVHYTWDVTLYRPGVYGDGQPAEAVWHLVVERAHAFDPVWARAQQAIASRLLYIEPDADPLPLDELLGALRRARVR
ncbi:MAG: peptidoglycan-binding domain-containing protein [Deltaproteobacteria bacterium]|nr:peptidoglycan-binding domain-containing protein [Deltaproteobacteria bacterium]